MATILTDKKHRDVHLLTLFLNGIELLGPEAIEQATDHFLNKREFLRAQTDGCNGVPMPGQPPAGHTLGHYYCTKDGWQWEDELG